MTGPLNDPYELEYCAFGPLRCFALPPKGGYAAKREWFALTYEGGHAVSASLVEALDPCVLAQGINFERGLSGSDRTEQFADALHQEVRILMELGEIDRVWRVESTQGRVRTTVQPADHIDAAEDMETHGGVLARRTEPSPLPSERPARLSKLDVMAQCGVVGELIDRAMERSDEYVDAMDESQIGMTWGGLADALGLAEAIFIENDPFLDDYRISSLQLAELLRPNSSDQWKDRRDAYRAAFVEKRIDRKLRAVAA